MKGSMVQSGHLLDGAYYEVIRELWYYVVYISGARYATCDNKFEVQSELDEYERNAIENNGET